MSKKNKTSLQDIGEFGLIEKLLADQPIALPDGVVGAGDDCAVLPHAGGYQVITTDAMVLNRHFMSSHPAEKLGWKLLAVSLSDIAAMGAVPTVALITAQLPASCPVEFVEGVYAGLYELAKQSGVSIIGGDTVSSEILSFSSTVIGETSHAPILRSGASAGEDLWVSGGIGASHAGLRVLKEEIPESSFPENLEHIKDHHLKPRPRLALGKLLGESAMASAMVDISDGLAQDASHIGRKSGVSIEIDLSAVPYGDGVLEAKISQLDAICGGEDYELLFTATEQKRAELEALSQTEHDGKKLPRLRRIGKVGDGRAGEVQLLMSDGSLHCASELLQTRTGFDHFAS